MHDVCPGALVLVETVCRQATELVRWNDNVTHVREAVDVR
jgi:hypothetical protein